MLKLQNMPQPLVPNGFGPTWLGCLVKKLGANYEEISCRGSWDGLQRVNNTLMFNMETAWAQCEEVEQLLTYSPG